MPHRSIEVIVGRAGEPLTGLCYGPSRSYGSGGIETAREPTSASPTSPWDLARGRHTARIAAAVVVAVAVAVPLLRMVSRAAASSRMQYADYWPMLDSFITDDADIRWESLREARNGHPIVLGKLLYILNVWLFDGSNRTQSAMVILMALAIVAVVAALARGTDGLGRWGRVAVVAFAALAVFAPAGAWTYVKAMSGTAWLSANLFIVVALLLQQRDRKVLSVGAAALASISYGTALAAWPAMAIAGLLRHGRRWQDQWLVWAGGAVAGGLYLRWRLENPVRSASGEPMDIIRRSVLLTTERFLPGRFQYATFTLLVLVGAFALWTCRSRLSATAPWVAMVVYGTAATLMIARTRTIEDGADSSRYWSVSMWIWTGLFAVVVLATRGRWWRPVVVVGLTVLILAKGTLTSYNLQVATENNDLLAIGVVAGIAAGNQIAGGSVDFLPLAPKLRALGHYPFDGSFEHGCGLIGGRAEVEPEPPAGLEGGVQVSPMENSPGVVHHRGAIEAPGLTIECVVVVDADGRVVGAGIHRASSARSGRYWIRSVAPPSESLTVAVRLEPDGPFHPLPIEPVG